MSNQESHEVRDLKWRLSAANKQLGKQGATIYNLRNEVTSLRATADLRNIGDYRRLLAEKQAVEEENRRLREKLRAKNEGDNE